MQTENQSKKYVRAAVFRLVLVILIDIMTFRSFYILDKTDRLHGSDVTAIFLTVFKGNFKTFFEGVGWLCEHYLIFCILLLVWGIYASMRSYAGYIKWIYSDDYPGKGYLLALLMVFIFMVITFAAAEYCILDFQPEPFIYRDTYYTGGYIISVSEPQKAPQLNPFAQKRNLYTCTFEYYVDDDDSDDMIAMRSQMNTHVLFKAGDEVGVNIDPVTKNAYIFEDMYDESKPQAGILFFIFVITLNFLAPAPRDNSAPICRDGIPADDD